MYINLNYRSKKLEKYLDLLSIKVPECFYIKEAHRIVQTALQLAHKDYGETELGGYLVAGSRKSGEFACMPVYESEESWNPEYAHYALEKAIRQLLNGDTRSMTTRNDKAKQFGGGIRMGDLIVSFSAFKEKWDEAISVAYASYCAAASAGVKDVYAFAHKTMMEFMVTECPDNICISLLADALYKK